MTIKVKMYIPKKKQHELEPIYPNPKYDPNPEHFPSMIRKEINQKFYRVNPDNKKVYKAGMFYAYLYTKPDEPLFGEIRIGFSFCNKYAGDRYDILNKKRIKGYGIKMAIDRSDRWSNRNHTHIGGGNYPGVIKSISVILPSFAVIPLIKFIERCLRYFRINGVVYPLVPWAHILMQSIEYKGKKWKRSIN